MVTFAVYNPSSLAFTLGIQGKQSGLRPPSPKVRRLMVCLLNNVKRSHRLISGQKLNHIYLNLREPRLSRFHGEDFWFIHVTKTLIIRSRKNRLVFPDLFAGFWIRMGTVLALKLRNYLWSLCPDLRRSRDETR